MIATRESYGEALKELAGVDNLVVLDADVGSATKSKTFKEVAPDRFFNMGIAEQDMIGTAAGLATCGKNVFASSFAVFATGRCYDQIRNTVAYSKLNVKIIGTHAGLNVGEDGASHQALEDIALMRSVPNMKVYSPCDDVETKALIKYLATAEGPAYVRLSRAKTDKIFNSMDFDFDPVKGHVLNEGKDVTIISTGIITSNVLKAKEILEEANLKPEIIELCSIKPIDKELLIKSISKTKKVVTVEEHNIIGGLGSAVSEVIAEEGLGAKLLRLGTNDKFGKSGKSDEVIKMYGLDPESIASKIKTFV